MAAKITPPNIYIIGAQCTGKTTLVNALIEYFKSHPSFPPNRDIIVPRVVSEVARTVLKQHNFNADDITSSVDRCLTLQKLILGAQAAAERSALEEDRSSSNDSQGSLSRWLLSDRSGCDPIVYALRYTSWGATQPLLESNEWLELKERMAGSVIVVCEAGCSWLTDDGVRLMPEDKEDWMRIHTTFCTFLDEIGLQYHVLPSNMQDLSDRLVFVLSKWKAEIGG